MALHSFDTVLQYHNGSALATVGAVTTIAISMASSVVDTTHLGSAARTYTKGIFSAGEASFTVQFDTDSTDLIALLGQLAANPGTDPKEFKVLFSDSGYFSFNGILTKFDVKADVDGVITADLSLQISGAVTMA